MTSPNETKSKELPEIEVRVSPAWIRFIQYCKVEAPHAEVKIQIANGQPTKLIDIKKNIRFDRENTIPLVFDP